MCNHDCFNCVYEDCICNDITLDEFNEINKRNSTDANYSREYKRVKKYFESDKGRKYLQNYRKSEKYREYQRKYNQTEKRKAYKKEYNRLYALKRKEQKSCQS